MHYTDAEWHLYWSAVAKKHEERKEAMKNEQLEFDFVKDHTLPSGTEPPVRGGTESQNTPSGKADDYNGGWWGIVPPHAGSDRAEVETVTATGNAEKFGKPTGLPVGSHTYQHGTEYSYDPRKHKLDDYAVAGRIPSNQPTPPEGYEIIPSHEYDKHRDDNAVRFFRGGRWIIKCYGTDLSDHLWYCRPIESDQSDHPQNETGCVPFGKQELSDEAASALLSEFSSGSKSEFEVAAEQIGRLVTEKNLAYGNSFVDSAKILAVLYPDGIPVKSYEDAGVIIRVVDKLKRIATDNDPFGEDPWEDIAGYGIIAHVRRTHKRREAIVRARREDEYDGSDGRSD